jgi:transposase-like protein
MQQRILVMLGAHRYRCAACRKNFVSFLPRQSEEAVLTEV